MKLPGMIVAAGIAVLAALAVGRGSEPPPLGPQTESRFPPLELPAGFKATLFACDPLIEYPSAIAAGPRPGAIFVAVDYMTGLGTDIVRRSEVRLVEDTDGDGYADRAPVFAGGFNSIEGLAWHDGSLYVMHAPFLTVLHDKQGKGIADERSDLLSGLGLTPEENPVRLHCANGVVAGHDGWLYLALGDHGCDVRRPEGDRLVFPGGGILRCRPDGRDLHVFASGLRNIYDVALDEELNVFVRDNENDGGTYKIRVCHSFHGADHGYPYLYEERPGEALPPLADLGLGSSAGGACYLERQFPAEYRGSLLFCEWGRSVVRYPLRSRGSSFERPTEIEFAAGAKNDPYGFKPTDLVVQRDGTVMISDYADGQRPKRGRGRIYTIRFVGDGSENRSASEPPAAGAGADPRLTRLDSDSYWERCDAQRAIEREDRDGLAKLRDAIARRQLGARGRLHAVWALAHAEPAVAIAELLKLARSETESQVRAQAIRAIADLADPVLVYHRLDAPRGDTALAAQLAAIGQGQDARIALETCIALGRLRWEGTADWLKASLKNPDAPLAHAATQALRRSGNWPAVLTLLDLPSNDPLRAIALVAVAERYEPLVVDGLIERLQAESSPLRRHEYADLLTRAHKKPGPWTYWGYRPPPRPPNLAAWERTEPISQALDRALASFEPPERLALLRRMQREQIPAPAATLTQWLESERQAESVAAILAAFRDQPAEDVHAALERIVRNAEHSLANRRAALVQFSDGLDDTKAADLLTLCRALEDGPLLADALHLLSNHRQVAAAPLLSAKLDSSKAEVRAAAIEVLGEIRGAVAQAALRALLGDADARVRRSAAAAAGKLMAKDAGDSLLKLTADADPSVRQASFAALALLNDERALPLAVNALADPQVHLPALQYIRQLGGPAQANKIAALAKHHPSTEVLTEVMRTLDDWRRESGASPATIERLDQQIAEIQGTTGVLIRWEVSGPIAKDWAPSPAKQAESGWRTVVATGTEARVVLAAKAPADDGSFVARSQLWVDQPTDVEFRAASSGALRVWLNGQSVYERGEPQGFRVDSDHFAATLVEGDNRLVVRVAPSAAPVEFHLRFRRRSATAQHERLIEAALARAGNADRGRQVAMNADKSLCLKCHRVGDLGERTGPELTGIGTRFSRIYLVESILEPSRTIAPSFGSAVVLLRSGQTLSGVKTAETESEITLVDNQAQKHVVLKSEVEQQRPSSLSAMPEGLEKRLTDQEFVDLIGFLMSLKESRSP